jgi:hypothetical protein
MVSLHSARRWLCARPSGLNAARKQDSAARIAPRGGEHANIFVEIGRADRPWLGCLRINQLLKKEDPIARLDPRDYEMAGSSRRQSVRKIHFVSRADLGWRN